MRVQGILSETNSAGADRMRLLLRNARQMKRIVEATYPSLNFEDEERLTGKECKPPLVRQKGDIQASMLTVTGRRSRSSVQMARCRAHDVDV